MLAYILAIAVGLGSLVFYMAAFFFPEVHRKYDFLWSGVGLFYALVLWICAGRITGGVLLGQTAAVALVGWLGWQTLTLRRTTTPAEGKTAISPEVEEKAKGFSVGSLLSSVTNLFRKPKTQSPAAAPIESVATLVENEEAVEGADEEEASVEGAATPAATAEEATPEVESSAPSETIEEVNLEVENPAIPETVEEATLEVESAVIPETEETTDSVEVVEEITVEVVEAEVLSTPVSESEPEETDAESFADFAKLEEDEAESDSAIASEKTEPTPPKPPTTDMVDAARENKKKGNSETPVEEFAPEVELAPFAEPPREDE